ncbi:ImmA/IrrE family metallo-endopeptidase [Emticicia sp. C21]|uniref:helix-turn-helix domain-containing protein n=1 Tax=Emticicia sp. C21 TaxID=2302915 RepID=UPI001314B01E|nr:XRE family transcriptional regulator [Emticicia sp. C21]
MIELARESRGFTQTELCEKMNVRQGTVSKLENNELFLSDDYIEKISDILNYPKSFFLLKDEIYPPSLIYYRRKAKVPGRTQKQFEAQMNIIRIHIEKLLKRVEIPDANLIDWDVEKHGQPEKAALFLREKWRLPKGKIENITRLLEDNGIIVIRFDFNTDKIDGLSLFTVKNQPIIYVNSQLPSDKERLTLAHELGHLVLHFSKITEKDRDLEKEAFRFGSEFLVPEFDFRRSFAKLNLKTLANLKRFWKVSMSSLIVKASNIGILTPNEEKYLWQQMAPYRLREPEELDFAKEQPSLVKEIIEVHKQDFELSSIEIAEILSLGVDDYYYYYEGNLRKPLQIIR